MVWMQPTWAIVASALGALALLALYVLRLRRRPVRVSSVRWWPGASEDAQANVPFQRPRLSWLLALHALAVALLACALGRPVLTHDATRAERVVVMIDRSASMSARDEGESRTRLELAQERAHSVLDHARENGAMVSVIALGPTSELVTGWTRSRSLLRSGVDEVTQSDGPADTAGAARLLDALTREAGEQDGAHAHAQEAEQSAEAAKLAVPTELVLVSDGGTRAESDAARAIAVPQGVRARLERVGGEAPVRNVGITRIAARRDVRDPTLFRVFCEVTGPVEEERDVVCTLLVGAKEAQRTAVRLLKAGDGVRARMTFEARDRGACVASVVLDGVDAIPADNAASVVLGAAQGPAVCVVRGPDEGAAAWLLDDVLAELAPGSLTHASRAQGEAITKDLAVSDVAHAEDAVLPSVMVYDGHGARPAALPRVPTLHFGHVPELASLALDASGALPGALGEGIFWQRNDPLLQGVSLDTLVIEGAPAVRTAAAPGESAEVLARLGDVPLIVRVRERGVARIVVTFDLFRSNWPLSPGFAVFVANALAELAPTGADAPGEAWTTGESITIAAHAGQRVDVTGPVARTIMPAPGAIASTTIEPVSLGVLEKAGVYGARVGGGDVRPLAVNVCDDGETLARTGGALPWKVDAGASAHVGAGPRELWPWCVMVLGLLLCAEWVLYARSVRS